MSQEAPKKEDTDKEYDHLVALNDDWFESSGTPSTMVLVTSIVFTVFILAVFSTWLAGLIRMGACGGSHTGYFWATLLLFFIPGFGTTAGFVMAIVALVLLRPGNSALGMTCAI